MPFISQMPPPGPLTGLELVPALQGGGVDGNCSVPLLLTGAPFGGAVLALRAAVSADLASTADGDPGAGAVRWNHADPDEASTLFISDTDADSGDLSAAFSALEVGGFVYLQGSSDSEARNRLQKWQVVSLEPATGYTKVGVTLQASGGTFSDQDALELTVQNPLPTPGVNRNIVTPLASSSGTVTVDCTLGDYFTLGLSEDVESWLFQNVPPACSIMVRITQDATARALTWPASFRWAGGSVGSGSSDAGAVDVLALTTFDAGATWQATLAKAFS